jgi:alkaline phosphatase
MRLKQARMSVAMVLAPSLFPLTMALAGPDDDARFRGDGVTRNSVEPIVGGGLPSDNPTNAEANTGLRILPPTGTQLIVGQRFDLRVETQIPATTPPDLKRLSVNGEPITRRFLNKIAAQDTGRESGTPQSNLLYGATARNLTFRQPGTYTVEAMVSVNGVDRTIENTYSVSAFSIVATTKKSRADAT